MPQKNAAKTRHKCTQQHYLQSGANFHLHVVAVVKFDEPHDEDVTEEDQKTADGRQDRCPRPATEQTKTKGHLGEKKI